MGASVQPAGLTASLRALFGRNPVRIRFALSAGKVLKVETGLEHTAVYAGRVADAAGRRDG